MTAHKDDILIQRYLLGDLEGAELEEFERRLALDTGLARELAAYRSLNETLGSLADPQPPADLWTRRIRPALAERIGDQALHHPGALSAFLESIRTLLLRPAIVVTAFALVFIGVTFLIQQQLISPAAVDRYDQAIANIQKLRDQFLTELQTLTEEMEKRKPLMSAEMRSVYDRTLKDIDDSIAKAERFYFAAPNDSDAVQTLFTAYEHKAEFIEQFKQLEPVSPEV
jgi:hypothetical protein